MRSTNLSWIVIMIKNWERNTISSNGAVHGFQTYKVNFERLKKRHVSNMLKKCSLLFRCQDESCQEQHSPNEGFGEPEWPRRARYDWLSCLLNDKYESEPQHIFIFFSSQAGNNSVHGAPPGFDLVRRLRVILVSWHTQDGLCGTSWKFWYWPNMMCVQKTHTGWRHQT